MFTSTCRARVVCRSVVQRQLHAATRRSGINRSAFSTSVSKIDMKYGTAINRTGFNSTKSPQDHSRAFSSDDTTTKNEEHKTTTTPTSESPMERWPELRFLASGYDEDGFPYFTESIDLWKSSVDELVQQVSEDFEGEETSYSYGGRYRRQADLTVEFLGSIYIVYGNSFREGEFLERMTNIVVTSPTTATIATHNSQRQGLFGIDHILPHIEAKFKELDERVTIEMVDVCDDSDHDDHQRPTLHITALDPPSKEIIEARLVSARKKTMGYYRTMISNFRTMIKSDNGNFAEIIDFIRQQNNMQQKADTRTKQLADICNDLLRQLDDCEKTLTFPRQ